MMNQHGISVIIHTYKAEQHLERVLQSVAGFDELIVCDMESTDATLAIAERHGCRILTFPRGEHRIAEPARQFAIDRASCDWILTVDADELVSPELRDYLYAHIASEQPAAGLYLARRNYFMGRFLHAAYPDYVLRFFRREQTTWAPYVHTLPVVAGEVARIDKRRPELALEHLANDSVAVILRKTNDYSDNEQIKRSGKRYGVAALFLRPLVRFTKSYFIKGGCRDGVPGLIHALLDGVYQLVMVAKNIERRQGKP